VADGGERPRLQAGPVLAALFGAASTEFLHAYWPERHYAAHRPLSQLPAALRGAELASLDALAQRYRGAVTFGRGARDARTLNLDTHAPNLFKLGLTVYLADIAPFVAGMPALLQALERELGLPAACCKLGAFASPRGDGVSCHFDADDVISIQLQGSKVFHVAPPTTLRYPVGQQFGPGMLPADELYPQVGDGFPEPDPASFERITMEPGSVLFLPRGTWHRTEAGDDSFAVSIGIRPPAAMDRLLQHVRDQLLQDPAWRRPLYEARRDDGAGDALDARMAELLQRLPAVLAQIDGASLTGRAGPAARDDGDSRYQRIPMSTLEYAQRHDRLHVTVRAWDDDWIARTTMETEAPPHLAPVLDWLRMHGAAFSGAAFGARFAALPARDAQQLLALLVKARFLKALPFAVNTTLTTLTAP